MRAAVVGSGFVAQQALRLESVGAHGVWWPRVGETFGHDSPEASVERFRLVRRADWTRLIDELGNADVVINAAGLADPAGHNVAALRGANATLPLLVLRASEEAGVQRMIHVSSAAVQGRAMLTEAALYSPLTAYGRSKALGEHVLLSRASPCSVVILRATSIHGVHRSLTRSLLRLRRLPRYPVVDRGSRPLPFAHERNLKAALETLVSASPGLPSIVLQPYEGVTTGVLGRWLAAGPPLELPRATARLVHSLIRRLGDRTNWTAAQARRGELLLFGQAQEVSSLQGLGYKPSADHSDWVKMFAELRSRQPHGDQVGPP